MQDDYVACFLDDIYTPGERTLIDAGQFSVVQAARLKFQDVTGPDLRQIVEQAIGRRVVAFMSQVSVDPDMAVEAFVLAADGSPGDSE